MAVSVDPAEKSQALVEKLGLTYPVLSDMERSATKAFGVHDPANDIAWPAVFIIAKDGAILWRNLSETYKERPKPDQIIEAIPAD